MIRLDKCLCHLGYGTRKDVKKIIKAKEVTINGVVCTKEDTKFDENKDEVIVQGIVIHYQEFVYIMLNKPKDVVSATEDQMHETVLDCIGDVTKGLFPVGRLDIDTVGLCLITNDGKLAHNLLSPKKHVDKTYYVQIATPLSQEHIQCLENGITIDGDELCKPAKVEMIDDHSLNLTISEGKYHQIKRMMIACGSEVVFLKRLTMGPLHLDPNVVEGDWRYLSDDEVEALKSCN